MAKIRTCLELNIARDTIWAEDLFPEIEEDKEDVQEFATGHISVV